MNGRPYFVITASILMIVAIAHLTRLLFHWPVVLAGWSVPVWISLPGLLVPGALAWWGFRLAREAGAADR
jgi:hypothetical protein